MLEQKLSKLQKKYGFIKDDFREIQRGVLQSALRSLCLEAGEVHWLLLFCRHRYHHIWQIHNSSDNSYYNSSVLVKTQTSVTQMCP